MKKAFFLLPLIIFLALGLRLFNLTILPVFADEAIYIRWSQVMVSEPTLRFLPLSDGKQPLFMWILMFLVRRFSDPLFIGRLLSVMSGLATLLGIFFISLTLFKSPKAALTSAVLYAVSPFTVFFDRMALVDSMLAMFTTWTFLFAILTAKTGYPSLAMLTGFALGAATLTKSPAIFVAFLLPTVWLLSKFPKNRKKFLIHCFYASGLLLATYFIALMLYNIQRLGPNFQMLTSRTKDYVFPLSHLWQNPRDPFIFYFHRGLQWIGIMGPWGIFIILSLALITNSRKLLKEKLILFLWFIFPFVVQAMFAKVFTARYILYTLPPLYILAGLAITSKNKIFIKLATFSLAFFVAQSLVYNHKLLTKPESANLPRSERSGYLEEWTAGTGIYEAADFIKSEHLKNPDKKIVVGTEGYFGTLPDGLQIYLESVPNVTVIGIGLGITGTPEPLAASKKAGNTTYLLANTSRLVFKQNPANLGLKLVASYQKADRPEGLREYVQYGPHDYLQLYEVLE